MKAGGSIVGVAVAAILVAGVATRAQVANRTPAGAAEEIEVIPIRPNVAVIAGAGGNITVQWGQSGTLLVNTGRAESAERVLAAIKKVTDQPISLIVSTSADADYVGGNVVLAKAGRNIFGNNPGENTAIYASEK